MTERPFNGDQEVIFKEIEEESRERLSQRSTIENVVDDNSGTFNTTEFFTRHTKITKIAAAVTTAFVLSGPVSAMAETNTKSIVYKNPGSIDQKYNEALGKLLAATDETTTNSAVTENLLSTEAIKSPSKLTVQIGSPYYEVTNSITGDVNVLKKMDKPATLDKSGK